MSSPRCFAARYTSLSSERQRPGWRSRHVRFSRRFVAHASCGKTRSGSRFIHITPTDLSPYLSWAKRREESSKVLKPPLILPGLWSQLSMRSMYRNMVFVRSFIRSFVRLLVCLFVCVCVLFVCESAMSKKEVWVPVQNLVRNRPCVQAHPTRRRQHSLPRARRQQGVDLMFPFPATGFNYSLPPSLPGSFALWCAGRPLVFNCLPESCIFIP